MDRDTLNAKSTSESVSWIQNDLGDEENTRDFFPIDSLPQVVFLNVLSFLNLKGLGRASCVSKYWYHSSVDPCLWRVLKLQKRQNVTDEVLMRITSIGTKATLLDISECTSVTEEGFMKSIEQCELLVELNTVRCACITDDCLATLGRSCKNLKFLDISLCVVTNSGIQKLCEGCTNLERLTMDQCRLITSDSLVSISQHCPRIKSVSVEYDSKVEDPGVVELVQGCPLLEKLHLNLCGITSAAVISISQYCTNMTVLDLRCCKSLGDDDVRKLTVGCKILQALNLSLCFNVTDLSLEHIVHNCTHLRSLNLVHCRITDKGLETFSSYGCKLERLDISWCQDVSDEGVTAVLKGCPYLKHLGLVRCDRVSEKTVTELTRQYPDVFLSTVMTEMNRVCKRAGFLGLVESTSSDSERKA